MPDQSTAATEHSLIQEITAPLATLPDDPLPNVADVEFPIVLRGYDRVAVDAYVKRTSQLVAELQATRSPEAAIRRALSRVGKEVSAILERAHETAEQLAGQSRVEAEDRLERARREAEQITADAERRRVDLDTETDRIWAERLRIVEDARELAQSLLTLADSAAARFPPAQDEIEEPVPGEANDPESWGEGEDAEEWQGDDGFDDPEQGEEPNETEATTTMPAAAQAEENGKLE